MTRKTLELYLGAPVIIKLHDGTEYNGILHKTGEANFTSNLNLYLPKNYYFITNEVISPIFRSSDVYKLKGGAE